MPRLSYLIETNENNGVEIEYRQIDYIPEGITWDSTNTLESEDDLSDLDIGVSSEYVRCGNDNDGYVYYRCMITMPAKSSTFLLRVLSDGAVTTFSYEVYGSRLSCLMQGDALVVTSKTNVSGYDMQSAISVVCNANGETLTIPILQEYVPIRIELVSYEYDGQYGSGYGEIHDVSFEYTFNWLTSKTSTNKETLTVDVWASGPRNGFVILDVSEYAYYGELDNTYTVSMNNGSAYQMAISCDNENPSMELTEMVYDTYSEGVYRKVRYNNDLKIMRDGNSLSITNYGRCFLEDDAYYVVTLANADNFRDTVSIIIRYEETYEEQQHEPATVVSISVDFDPGDNIIYDDEDLDDLKQYITVTALYSDGTTEVLDDNAYTLIGSLVAPSSLIIVDADGVIDSFMVEVEVQPCEYLCFTAASNDSSIALTTDWVEEEVNLEYSLDEQTWVPYTIGDTIDLSEGDKVYMRNADDTVKTTLSSYYDSWYYYFVMEGSIMASGNIMSLLDKSCQSQAVGEGCFMLLFESCESLLTPPELPATTLAEGCYDSMFQGCTSLTTAPELPATTLADNCYYGMFEGCTGLTIAPELSATTLAEACYSYMFNGCTSLTTAPELPATTLEQWCYAGMFSGCTSLNIAPALSATTLANNCYGGMFSDCMSLTTAPALQATTLAEACYSYMFNGCTSLTTAPILPATTLANGCYQNMLGYCTSLATAPVLPATTLADNCYYGMFEGCTSLATAPVLPATTLADNCYYGMFKGCTGLTIAPALPATTLETQCYYRMFNGCSNLQSIVCLATNVSATGCTNAWVSNVSPTGVFVKDPSMTGWTTGNNGIPTGWTVADNGLFVANQTLVFELVGGTDNIAVVNLSNDAWSITSIPEWITASVMSSSETVTNVTFTVSANATERDGAITISNGTDTVTISVSQGVHILTFIAENAGSTVRLNKSNSPYAISLEYSVDGGSTWGNYTWSGNNGTLITLANVGDSVRMRGVNSKISANLSSFYKFVMTGRISASGDITSLLNGKGGDANVPDSCFNHMFVGCASLTTAPALPATTLANYCYSYMFQGCIALTTAPALSATTLAQNCYSYMFSDCESLTTPPALSATTLANQCYHSMFSGCTSLTTAPALPATTLAQNCYSGMFQGCIALTTAPALSATTLAQNCYSYMFSGCESLTTPPALLATTLANQCYHSMFSGCTSLTTAPVLPATTLANYCYQDMLNGCESLTTAPELPATTLAEGCYYGMFVGCALLTTAPALPATTMVSRCYQSMFSGCTSLTTAPILGATTLATDCYTGMFNNCNHITSYHVATLNNSANMFMTNNSCTSFTIDDTMPPTIADNTITGLKSDCVIYVPAGSVNDYKAAQYWSARSAYIQANQNT